MKHLQLITGTKNPITNIIGAIGLLIVMTLILLFVYNAGKYGISSF